MYRALVSFSGVISMAQGEEREITNKDTIKDLVKAGYIEEVKSTDAKGLKKEVETLTKALEEANATIEALNKEVETLTKVDDENSDDTSNNEDADDENKTTDKVEGNENSDNE